MANIFEHTTKNTIHCTGRITYIVNRHYKLTFLLWTNLEINYYITTQVLKFVGNYIFTIVLDVIVKVSKFLASVSPHA